MIDEWGDGVAFNDAGPYDALLANDARVRFRSGREDDPNEGAAREFVRLLNDRGIRVDNGWGSGVASDVVPVTVSVQSAPLSDVIVEMLSTSDNNTAEMLVKEMGVVTSGTGTRAAGLDAMFRSLEAQGVPMEGVELRDGSGLSTTNRVTCDAVLRVLQLGRGGPLDAGLPIAAFSGTLADEFLDGPMVGRLRAKTGTLNNPPVEIDPPAVKALAGYVDPREGPGPGTIEFVLIVNTPDVTDDGDLPADLEGARRTVRHVSERTATRIARAALSIGRGDDLRSSPWRSCRCFHSDPCCCPAGCCRCTCSNRGIARWSSTACRTTGRPSSDRR